MILNLTFSCEIMQRFQFIQNGLYSGYTCLSSDYAGLKELYSQARPARISQFETELPADASSFRRVNERRYCGEYWTTRLLWFVFRGGFMSLARVSNASGKSGVGRGSKSRAINERVLAHSEAANKFHSA
jgi:hypothetical protein